MEVDVNARCVNCLGRVRDACGAYRVAAHAELDLANSESTETYAMAEAEALANLLHSLARLKCLLGALTIVSQIQLEREQLPP